MPDFLLHQLDNGTPVGVFGPNDEYYDPEHDNLADRGREIVRNSHPNATWDEIVDSVSSKTPVGLDRWSHYLHRNASLQVVLQNAQDDTSYD